MIIRKGQFMLFTFLDNSITGCAEADSVICINQVLLFERGAGYSKIMNIMKEDSCRCPVGIINCILFLVVNFFVVAFKGCFNIYGCSRCRNTFRYGGKQPKATAEEEQQCNRKEIFKCNVSFSHAAKILINQVKESIKGYMLYL